MESTKKVPANIDEYIAAFPEDVQKRLQAMRKAVKQGAPKATEAIKYAMPTFVLNGNLVHFAAFRKHISLFPGSKASVEAHRDQLEAASANVGDKGTIQFPNDKPLPLELVTAITKFRVKEKTRSGK